MSEGGDYDPGYWSGHDFSDARDDYRDHARASLTKAVHEGIKASDLVPKSISTNCKNPLVIITDETGSMGEWPATMFSKLPYLDHEARTEYQGKDVQISWAAIGDATNPNREKYPLQVREFADGKGIAERLKELVIEGDGGGTKDESYELAALYYARNCKMPKAIRPLLIFIGDESPYAKVNQEQGKVIAYCDLAEDLSTGDVFEELRNKFSVYFIQKPYGDESLTQGKLSGTTLKVHNDWSALVGEDHIALLEEPGRVVDVIFGIMAQEAGKVDYFKKEIEERQNPDQVKTTYRALNSIHNPSPKSNSLSHSGRSVTRYKKVGE